MKDISTFGTRWMDFESIMLCEVRQRKTDTIYFTSIWKFNNIKSNS